MLRIENDQVVQHVGGASRLWDIPELLSAYDPMEGEPLAIRNAVFQQILPVAEERYDELSEPALLRYHFWKNIHPRRIEERTYEYATRISKTYQWKATINAEGVFFADLSGQYGPPNQTYAQLLSDFWFHGPLMPMPVLEDRKWAMVQIRNAFLQVGGPSYGAHFPLFEYPPSAGINPPEWSEGDGLASDFVMLRPYGVEFGRQNFHDGLVFISFVSFEQVKTRRDLSSAILTGEILEEIREYLQQPAPAGEERPREDALQNILSRKERSKQLYMESMGMTHTIHLDGFGEEYQATAQEEAQWKLELIEHFRNKLETETNDSILKMIVERLHQWETPGFEDALLRRAEQANAAERQAIAHALWEGAHSEKAVDILLSFLTETDPYWRDYLVSTFSRMWESRRVRRWVLSQVEGPDEVLFRKAAGILRLWSITSAQGSLDDRLFLALNWQEKEAGSSAFRRSLARITHILLSD